MNRNSIYLALVFLIPILSNAQVSFSVYRFEENPIISPHMLKADDGSNINGPSLIKVPKWVKRPLGKYYLYFAHHIGKYIRMAYSDSLKGPWKIYHPGVLNLSATIFGDDPDEVIYTSGPNRFMYSHIASPEVIIDEEKKLLSKGAI